MFWLGFALGFIGTAIGTIAVVAWHARDMFRRF